MARVNMIVIPLGGNERHFRDSGYVAPKALTPLHGKPLIFYLLDCLPPDSDVLIICGHEYRNYDLCELARSRYPNLHVSVHMLTRETRGVAETLLLGLSTLDEDAPVLCLDGDTFYDVRADVVSRWRRDNCVFVLHDTNEHAPVYSYAKINGDEVSRIAEKDRISDYACVGAYGFRSARELCTACREIIGDVAHGEHYTSAAIQHLLDAGHRFAAIRVQQCEWHCIGTPLQMRLEALKLQRDRVYRFCFEIEQTLVHSARDLSHWKPIERNIAFLRFLHAEGHVVILHTARRMVGNVGADMLRMLADLQIPYDELVWGKPLADYYIDNAAIDARHDLEKATGFYCNSIEPRSFHTLRTASTKVIRKHGAVYSQIQYYLNISSDVRHLFPCMTAYARDSSWYEMQFVQGIPYSQLYVSELMTGEHFDMLLAALQRLHSSGSERDVPLYANYAAKLQKRFDRHAEVYATLGGADALAARLLLALERYEQADAAVCGTIHGDAVFTNILLQADDEIKFIDMRGSLGDTVTIFGDVLYDYAKVYQSLVGYDELLLNVRVSEAYRKRMLLLFNKRMGSRLPDVVTIASSLLFSLIPLHTHKRAEFFELAKSLLDTPL